MGLIVDLFAGGGGASLGVEMAMGRAVDVAINHNPEAVAIHAANHPTTRHFVQNICSVLPRAATGGRPVDVLWASPDCKHFSKAKGAAPKERNIRELAWAVVRWVRDTRPKLVCVENVEEFQTWGPLDGEGQPIKARTGETFRRWVKEIEREGYQVEWKLLRACDYGAPTIRRRLFVVARRDRKPVVWPEPTHGPDRAHPWRTAAECIDWSLPVPSIFDRKKPLAENTLKRVAEGLRRYVLESDHPFIVNPERVSWILQANTGAIGRPADWPISTVCQAGSHQQLAQAFLSPLALEIGGNDRNAFPMPMDRPFKTLLTRAHKSLVMANLAPFIQHMQHSGRGPAGVMPAGEPLRTITAYPKGGSMALVAANLIHYYGTSPGGRPRCGDLALPIRTATAAGNRFGLVSAFLTKANHTADYYNCFRGQSLESALQTITLSPGFSLVQASLAPFLVGAGGPRYGGKPVELVKPAGTLTAENHRAVVAAYLSHFYNTMQDGRLELPMKTVTSGGFHAGLVSAFLTKYYGTAWVESVLYPLSTITSRPKLGLTTAFLTKYYGNGTCHDPGEPLGTLTTRERYGLVLVYQVPLVWIEGEPYVIADIGLRMLTPRESARAQGFPDGYDFAPVVNGKPLTQKAQVAAIGNSVPPAFSDAIVRANLDALAEVPTKSHKKPMPLFERQQVSVGREG